MLRKYFRRRFSKGTSLLVPFLLFSVVFLIYLLNTKANLNLVKIKNCYDGDTCTTESGETIRLACIDADAPEIRGKNADSLKAKASREFINNLLSNKKMTIKRIDTDRYGRTVAEIFIEGTNIQKLMVKNGFAKIHRKYSFQCDWTYKMEKVFG